MKETYDIILGGKKETKNNRKFQQRYQDNLDNNIRGYKGEYCPRKLWQWSELKSSFLMKHLINSKPVHNELTVFILNVVGRISQDLNINIQDDITQYNSLFADSIQQQQKSKIRSYPVAQSQLHKNSLTQFKNFYPLYNYMKFIWYKLRNAQYYNPVKCIDTETDFSVYYKSHIIFSLQQNFLLFMDSIRGDRLSLGGGASVGSKGKKSSLIGISNLYNPSLHRQKVFDYPRDKIDQIEPWMHPGDEGCRIPYLGGWGKNLEKFRKNNTVWGSIQCGISGSTQYMLFMYLMSTSENPSSTPKNDVFNVIMSASLGLVGDGGHNLREVVFGLTTSVIILKNLIQDLKSELRSLPGFNAFNYDKIYEQFDMLFVDPNNVFNPTANMPLCQNIIYYIQNTIDFKQQFYNTNTGQVEEQSIYYCDTGFINWLTRYVQENNDQYAYILLNNYQTTGLINPINYYSILLSKYQANKNQYIKELTIKRFLSVLKSFGNWEEFIKHFYKLTKHINVSGIFEKDIDTFFSNTRSPIVLQFTGYKDNFSLLKQDMYKTLFYSDNKNISPAVSEGWFHTFIQSGKTFSHSKSTGQNSAIFNEMSINKTLLFFAYENDRFKKDIDQSFTKAHDTVIHECLKSYNRLADPNDIKGSGHAILVNVNKEILESNKPYDLQQKHSDVFNDINRNPPPIKCDPNIPENLSFVNKEFPFAFNSKRTKSRRRKSKRRKSRRGKSKRRKSRRTKSKRRKSRRTKSRRTKSKHKID